MNDLGGTDLVLGNDIVDLRNPENHRSFQRKGYVEKACSEQELNRFQPNNDAVIFWLLWAAKEATYKSAVKGGFDRVFSPRTFEIEKIELQSQKVEAEVVHSGKFYKIEGDCQEHFVHLISYPKEMRSFKILNSVRQIEPISDDELSCKVRELFFSMIAQHSTKPNPILLQKDKILKYPVYPAWDLSLSHDYGSVAVATRNY